MPFALRPAFDWRLRSRSLTLGRRTLVMGILNVTPDSFSDGGHFYDLASAPERALVRALELLDHGADLLDLGGESTRPGAVPLSPEQEQARVLPVLEAVLAEWTSSDTYANRVAALQAGVAYSGGTAHLDATTVSDAGAADTLTGGSGLDWFFAHVTGATPDKTDRTSSETLTAMSRVSGGITRPKLWGCPCRGSA